MVFVCSYFLTEILAHKQSVVSWTSKVTPSKKPAAYEVWNSQQHPMHMNSGVLTNLTNSTGDSLLGFWPPPIYVKLFWNKSLKGCSGWTGQGYSCQDRHPPPIETPASLTDSVGSCVRGMGPLTSAHNCYQHLFPGIPEGHSSKVALLLTYGVLVLPLLARHRPLLRWLMLPIFQCGMYSLSCSTLRQVSGFPNPQSYEQ